MGATLHVNDTGTRVTVPAVLRGETGWLRIDVSDGTYRYALTLDETKATRFVLGKSVARHVARAQQAGFTFP